jgi:hypothetical protein
LKRAKRFRGLGRTVYAIYAINEFYAFYAFNAINAFYAINASKEETGARN